MDIPKIDIGLFQYIVWTGDYSVYKGLSGSGGRDCLDHLGWMDGYFVYRRSTLKGHIASNKFYVI